jgi:hypothetical protein
MGFWGGKWSFSAACKGPRRYYGFAARLKQRPITKHEFFDSKPSFSASREAVP